MASRRDRPDTQPCTCWASSLSSLTTSGRGSSEHQGLGLLLVEGDDALAGPQLVDRGVAGDGQQPGAEAIGLAEPVEVLQGPGEGVLDDVGHRVGVVHVRHGHGAHRSHVGPVELVEGPGLPGAHLCHKLGIGSRRLPARSARCRW